MIPFGSQRGHGQDLATHLRNEHDNEYMELADVRGSIANDLHGAFAEWEAQAKAMTKCKNYLYSLSINPDLSQGAMPRELYDDYITRVEDRLGLTGQPRAIVYHIKNGREHAHVIWSRVDLQDMKAIHIAFDHDKLMSVTRNFARDHGIELAPGYHRLEDRKRQTYRQLSLYERAQVNETGISREDHRKVVTDLWQRRDTPAAFLEALDYHGYILAQGKRPFVLVDINGHTNALPKLINDKAVTQKVVAEFLGEVGKRENLPTIDEAKEVAARHRTALKDHLLADAQANKRDQLKASQDARRVKLEREASELKLRQEQARNRQIEGQRSAREDHQRLYEARSKLIQDQRDAARPTGLAEFLAKVSGVAYVRTKIHAHQDRKRETVHQESHQRLLERQSLERLDLQRRQDMQSFEMTRKQRALEQTEQRERQTLETHLKKEANARHRYGPQPAPTVGLNLNPPGRSAVPDKAKHRHTNSLSTDMRLAKQRADRAPDPSPDANKLQEDFRRAAGGDSACREGSNNTDRGGISGVNRADPEPPNGAQRDYRRRTQSRDHNKARER